MGTPASYPLRFRLLTGLMNMWVMWCLCYHFSQGHTVLDKSTSFSLNFPKRVGILLLKWKITFISVLHFARVVQLAYLNGNITTVFGKSLVARNSFISTWFKDHDVSWNIYSHQRYKTIKNWSSLVTFQHSCLHRHRKLSLPERKVKFIQSC